MHFSLLNLFYFAFRMGPFLLVSFFVMSSFFQQDLKCIIYIAGLLFACFLGIMTGNSLSLFDLPKGSLANTHCHVLSLGEATPMSKLPLSLIVYCYTAAYLAYPVMQFNKGNADLSLIALFPLLIIVEAMWLLTYQCFTGSSVVVAGAFATAIGFLWSWVVYNSNLKGLHTFTVMGGGQGCVRPAQSTFRCQTKSIDSLHGNALLAFQRSGQGTNGKPYEDGTGIDPNDPSNLTPPPGYGSGSTTGGNGNYYYYCTDAKTCFWLFDGDTVISINIEPISSMQYYRVSIPLQPGKEKGRVLEPAPTLLSYLNEEVTKSWDTNYQQAKKVLCFTGGTTEITSHTIIPPVPTGGPTPYPTSKPKQNPKQFLVIGEKNPTTNEIVPKTVYYRMPQLGSIVQFQNSSDIDSLMDDAKNSADAANGGTNTNKKKPLLATFLVQEFTNSTGEKVRKLCEFKYNDDLKDYKNTFNPIIDVEDITSFDISGCRKGVDMAHCDISGYAMPYKESYGHSRRPIIDPDGFKYNVSFTPWPNDPFVKNGKTNIYPEGTFLKCQVGGVPPPKNVKAAMSGSSSSSSNVSVPSTIYHVDQYGAIANLPNDPANLFVNYSWNSPSNDWAAMNLIYPNCSGIELNPTLGFNPSLLPPECNTTSCKSNQACIRLINSFPTIIDDLQKNGYFDKVDKEGEGDGKNLSNNLKIIQEKLNSMMIKKMSTGSDTFDDAILKSLTGAFRNINSDLTKINPITSPTYIKILEQQLTTFYSASGLAPPGWAIGQVPNGNQLQFKNQTNLCLEADDPNSNYYDSRLLIRNCDSSNPYQKWTYNINNNTLKNNGSSYCFSSRANKDNDKYGNQYDDVFVDKCDDNWNNQNIILDENSILSTAVKDGGWEYIIKANEWTDGKMQLDKFGMWEFKAQFNVI